MPSAFPLLAAATTILALSAPAPARECRTWFKRSPPAPIPSPRGEYGLAYDSDRARTVLIRRRGQPRLHRRQQGTLGVGRPALAAGRVVSGVRAVRVETVEAFPSAYEAWGKPEQAVEWREGAGGRSGASRSRPGAGTGG